MQEELKFEEALRQLEEIVGKLEGGELSLEESMTAFEQGTRLCQLCNAKLTKAEKKIEKLTKVTDNQPEWENATPEHGN